jgi:hypothetical protein
MPLVSLFGRSGVRFAHTPDSMKRMKIYNINLDEYGWPIEFYRFLCDGHGSHSGWKWSALLEMKLWNFIARIINWII